MKYNKYIYTLITLLAIGFFSTSCTDSFEDINKDPHQIAEDGYSNSHRYISSIIQYSGNLNYTQENGGLAGGGHLMERIKMIEQDVFAQFTTGGFSSNDSYNSDYFSGHYTSHLKLLNKALEKTDIYLDEDNLIGYALTWRTFLQSNFTDHFGPAPYPRSSTETNGEYIPLKDQYKYYFEDLETAIQSFDESQDALKIEPAYNGDVKKWLRFANSLRLRLALKVSEIDENLSKEQIKKSLEATKNGELIGFILEGEDLTAKSYSEWGNTYPYSVIGWQNIILTTSMSKNLSGLGGIAMEIPNDINKDAIAVAPETIDPRALSMYSFAKHNDKYYWQGMNPNKANAGDFSLQVSRMNASVFRGSANADREYKLMTYSEVCFLLAEAFERKLAAGNAKEMYENGIRASFKEYGVDAKLDEYLASASKNGWGTSAKYDDDITSAGNTNLEKIISQKYIALYPDMSIQVWNDKRRLNLPAMDIPEVRPDGLANWPDNDIYNPLNFIQRNNFPLYEEGRNRENYAEGVNILVAESGGNSDNGDRARTPLWWASKLSNYCTSTK